MPQGVFRIRKAVVAYANREKIEQFFTFFAKKRRKIKKQAIFCNFF